MNIKTILVLLVFCSFGQKIFSQKTTLDSLYFFIKEKNIESYKKLFSDSSYIISGRRLSILRNKGKTNIKVTEIKTNIKNERLYSIFKLTYDNKEYPKLNNDTLIALLIKTNNNWQIEEICENSEGKGELYINKKINKYYDISKIGHDKRSDSLGVNLTLELESDRILFDKKYKIFKNNYWLNTVGKNLKIKTKDLTHAGTNTYYDPTLKKGLIQFSFSIEKDAIFFQSCLYYKIDTKNNIIFYDTDGQNNETNLFK